MGLRHTNHAFKANKLRVNFDCIFPLFRLVLENLGRWVWARTLRVYKVSQKLVRVLAKRRLCLGLPGVINCTPLSALSFWVSLFPRTCGYTSNEYSGLNWLVCFSLQSKGLSRVFSSTTIWKHQFFGTQTSLWHNFHIHPWLLEKP